MLLKPLIHALSPAGERAKLSVLIFHRVLARPDPVFPGEVDAERFDRICGWVRQWFNVLPLDQAVARLKRRELPARALAISFDDGYADNHDVAMPILQRHGLSATFFIATGFLDGGRMFNDTVIQCVRRTALEEADFAGLAPNAPGRLPLRTPDERRHAIEAVLRAIKYLPPAERLAATERLAGLLRVQPTADEMMSSAQVRAMRRGGMGIGAHTVNHPILSVLDEDAVRAEIGGSRDFLEQLLGERVPLFAYPNGKPGEDYDADTVRIARGLGFDAALSTVWGSCTAASDDFQLPRFTPWDRDRWRFGARLAANLRRPN